MNTLLLTKFQSLFRFNQFLSNILFLFQDPIQVITLHLVMSPLPPLADNFSTFLVFDFEGTPQKVPYFGFISCVSHGFCKEDHRGEVSFLHRHTEGTYYHRDFFVITWLRQCLSGFSTIGDSSSHLFHTAHTHRGFRIVNPYLLRNFTNQNTVLMYSSSCLQFSFTKVSTFPHWPVQLYFFFRLK